MRAESAAHLSGSPSVFNTVPAKKAPAAEPLPGEYRNENGARVMSMRGPIRSTSLGILNDFYD